MAAPWERLGTSRAAIDRAGDALRNWSTSGILLGPTEQEAMELLAAFRGQFNLPLTKVVMGLKSAVGTSGGLVGGKEVVGQRLKRQPRIISKLVRFPRMELSRMQDVAGCRAVLPDLVTVKSVQYRVEHQKSEVVSIDDYNDDPKPSGYRAVHLVVRRDGTLIEVQLRTGWQQEWATLVEDLDGTYGLRLKDDRGPDEVMSYLRLLALAQLERYAEGVIRRSVLRRLGGAREVAGEWLEASRGLRR